MTRVAENYRNTAFVAMVEDNARPLNSSDARLACATVIRASIACAAVRYELDQPTHNWPGPSTLDAEFLPQPHPWCRSPSPTTPMLEKG